MFTNTWFQLTGRANFNKYVLPLEGDLYFLEVGCYEGQASRWMLENTNAKLTVVDTFAGGQDLPDEVKLLDRFKENVEPFKGRIEINQGRSGHVLKDLYPDHFDFIYIDGSHLAKDVLEDAVLSFPLLRSGGIMIFDDYTWGPGLPFYERPCSGIDAFVQVYGDQIEILEKNSQLIMRKK